MTLAEIAQVVGGVTHGDADVVVDQPAYLDSRTPLDGGLYVAIVGERVDGHDYADHAGAVLGSRPTGAPTVVVEDPVAALARLARHLIDRLTGATVLALTGSQGKTGTKDYLAAVLETAAPTVATAGNLNNELGVPLTVLRATAETRYLVVEMGARGVGHIGYLCEIAPPAVAAVLNVGTAHLGEFGSRAAIAQAKGEIVEALPPTGHAVLNLDDRFCSAMRGRTTATVRGFGARAEATSGEDVTWRDVEYDDLGRPAFDLVVGEHSARVHLALPGEHQVANAAAAAAMALAVGLELPDVAEGLTAARPASRWRMELTERADGLLVLNDAYNANPESTRAALDTLARIGAAQRRRTVAVLGEMLELGTDHEAGHRDIGAAAVRAGAGVLLVIGAGAAGIADGAEEVARSQDSVIEVIRAEGHHDATVWLSENAGADDVVLIKASRGAALEVIAQHLLATEGDSGP